MSNREEIFRPEERANIGALKGYVKGTMPFLNQVLTDYYGATGLNYIIAGGFFASKFHNEAVHDIDIFFLDPNQLLENYFVFPKMKEEIKKESETEYMSNPQIIRAITFKTNVFNFIYTKYPTREALMDEFDLQHCCVSYDPKIDGLFISRATYDALANKKLIPHKPGVAIKQFRMDKYITRGYRV
jgi:hypothetical protein